MIQNESRDSNGGNVRSYAHMPARRLFFGVYSWLVKVLGQFSIIYFRGLGLRIVVRVWVRVRVGVRVVHMFGVMVMVRVNTTRNINPDP